jgi:SPP1 gp7 family putative phage head morphogenesis protein
MPNDEPLSKAELALIDKIIVAAGLAKFRNVLWQKVRQAFGFSFHGTNIEYGFARATPDERALAYLNDRIFILSDKTQAKLVGDLRWELLEGMKNAESIDEIKRRLDGIFEGNTVQTERIARTEVLNALGAGRQSAHVQAGIANYKQWKAAMKNARTAADSKWLNGQIQEIENPFVYKDGSTFMHNPNRPNCRCTVLYLCKLPENIVHKGGQMYAADEMVGKIEIDMGSLSKSEKRIWVRPTSKRKGHYRRIKGAKEEVETKPKENLQSYIDKLSKTEEGEKQIADTEHYISGGFGIFNGYLRGEMQGTIKEFDEKIKNITNFLTDAPKFESVVYRGMFFDERMINETKNMESFFNNLEVGGEVEMVAFTSTTKESGKAIEFAGTCENPEDCTRILFEIKSKNGVDLEPMSRFKHEKEVLFNQKTKFRVVDIFKKPPNNVNVKMEEI